MPQLNAYLSFNGNCPEAIRFCARLLGTKLEARAEGGNGPGRRITDIGDDTGRRPGR